MSYVDSPLRDLGYACISLKTTGLTHGYDRICEVSVAVADPGQPIRLALDTAKLLRHLLGKVGQMGLNTLGSLRGKKRHPFQATLEQDAMLKGMTFDLEESVVRFSRHERGVEGSADLALALYWDALLVALDDLVITEEEQEHLARLKGELELEDERIHMLHARAFSGSLVAMIDAGEVTEDHRTHLTSLRACLAKLGWCPGD